MKSYAIITGGGTGIGRSLALQLAKHEDLSILIIGRTLATLKETQSLASRSIEILQADVSTDGWRQAIFNAIPPNAGIKFLIHNATFVEGGELKNISQQSWREQMAVNLDAPLFLTQKLLPLLKNGRILHISSGFAHMPSNGLGAYCIAKAGLYMMYQCLALELQKDNISVGSLRPGVVDTPLQEKLREIPVEIFPALPKFKAMKEEHTLQSPEKVAKFIEWVLLNTDDSKFSEAEWNIADTWHQNEWFTQ